MTDLSVIGRFGRKGGRVNELKECRDIVELPDGAGFIVSDAGNHRLQRYATDGEVIPGHWGPGYGTGPKSFNKPTGMVLVDDELVVCDENNLRVQTFNVHTGEHMRTIMTPKPDERSTHFMPYGLATFKASDGKVELYILENLLDGLQFHNRVVVLEFSCLKELRIFDVPIEVFTPSNSSHGMSGSSATIAVASGVCYIGDRIGTSVATVPHGAAATSIGGMRQPYAVACDAKLNLYAGEHESGYVHRFSRPSGNAQMSHNGSISIEGAKKIMALRLSVDGKKLYAVDSGAGCVHILSTTGEQPVLSATGEQPVDATAVDATAADATGSAA